jgi:hypothetical protein
VAPTFVVARNPDAKSTLPYLLRLPVDGGIEHKARVPWPATARVYCHPLEEGWPEAADVIEEVPVRRCALPAAPRPRSLGRNAPYRCRSLQRFTGGDDLGRNAPSPRPRPSHLPYPAVVDVRAPATSLLIARGSDAQAPPSARCKPTAAPTASAVGAWRSSYGTTTWIVFDARSPSAYVTVSVTSNVPERPYVYVGLSSVELRPSPKSQR